MMFEGTMMTPTATPPRYPTMLSSTPGRRTHYGRKQLDLSNSLKRTRTAHGRQRIPPPSPTTDRFIPSRPSAMDIHLTSCEIQESDKRREKKRRKEIERQRRFGDDGDETHLDDRDDDDDDDDRRTRTTDEDYRRAMGAALHNLPIEEFASEMTTTGTSASGGSMFGENRKRTLKFGAFDARPATQQRIDPFVHSHHKVIERTLASSNDTRAYQGISKVLKKPRRTISDAPKKSLHLPGIVDDYYLNLISWSKDNIVAAALGPSVFIWNACTEEVEHVVTLEGDESYVSSVSWCTIPGCTKYLAVGTSNGATQLWDTQVMRQVRKMGGHDGRVASLSWNDNTKWMTSGSRDSRILQHDVRCGGQSVVANYSGHTREVCGLAWDEEGRYLASGGNDDLVCIWDATVSNRSSSTSRVYADVSSARPVYTLTDHKAAVKALDWCPWSRGVLASGGGSADRSIKFWNTVSGKMTRSVDTGSQVSSLVWSKHSKELCSSHGQRDNQLILWEYPTMRKIRELKGHTGRVLNMELSPNGSNVASLDADETLMLWDVFGPPPRKARGEGSFMMMGSSGFLGMSVIR